MKKRASIYILIFSFILSFTAYFSFISHRTVGIDTESIINNYQGQLDAWRSINRFGLVKLKELLWGGEYRQLMQNIFALLTLGLLAFLLIYLYKKSSHMFSNKKVVLFLIAFIACPITYLQMYFQLQNFEVLFGTLLTTIAIYLSWKFALTDFKTKFPLLLLSSVLIGFSLSIYQSMLDFSIALFFSFIIISEQNKILGNKDIFRLIVTLVLNLLLSLVIYLTLNTLFNRVPRSNYNALEFFNYKSLAMIFIIGLIAIFFLVYTKYKRKSFMYSFTWFAFLVSPFLTSAMTGVVVFRAFFPAMPLILAFLFVYFADKIPKGFAIFFSTSVIMLGITIDFQIKEIKRYSADVAMSHRLIEQINNLGIDENYSDYRIQFVGKNHTNDMLFHIPGEPVGQSFYGYDPLPYQDRSDAIMHLLGFDFQPSSLEENNNAVEVYQELPNYPENGAIIIEGTTIIVKFSN